MLAAVPPNAPVAPLAPPAREHLWAIVVGTDEHLDGGGARLARPGRRSAWRPGPGRPSRLARMLERATRVIPPERVVAVVSRGRDDGEAAALEAFEGVRRVVQPLYRGSAAEVFLPLRKILGHDPAATVVVLPTVAVVDDEARFMHHVARAVWAVALRPDVPLVLGARPRSAEGGRGWIEPGALVPGLESLAAREVRRFVHEPAAAERRRLFQGEALVCTFVLAARARTLAALGERYLPDVVETLEPLPVAFGVPEEDLLGRAVYECMPYASLSRELLERGSGLAVLPVPDLLWHEDRDPVRVAAAS